MDMSDAVRVAPPPSSMLRRLGPGLITGAADDDPSGIATYKPGRRPVRLRPGLDHAVQPAVHDHHPGNQRPASAASPAHGIAENLRRHYSPWLVRIIVLLLLVANIINLGADLGAMGAALSLLLGGSPRLYTVAFGMLCVVAEIFISYGLYSGVLKWLTLSLFAYVGVVFAAHVPWSQALSRRCCRISRSMPTARWRWWPCSAPRSAPYLFFWQSALEVEDQQRRGGTPLSITPQDAGPQFARIRFDTMVGMAVSNLIAICIIYATAATLPCDGGVTNIQTSAQAAEALRPVAGPLTFVDLRRRHRRHRAAGGAGAGRLGARTRCRRHSSGARGSTAACCRRSRSMPRSRSRR